MRTVTNAKGTRDVSHQELATLREDAEAKWTTFWDSLVWQPIGEYARTICVSQLLRNGSTWALGYWGVATLDLPNREDIGGTDLAWRNAQDSSEEQPLSFEPLEFAVVSDDWRDALTED